MVVRLESVSKWYGETPVLRDLSLEVGEEERLVILGPSGCGKTTILRLIAGFSPPDEGEVYLGEELASDKGRVIVPPERRGVGMVFQDLALWPHLTVEENLGFGLAAKGMPREERKRRVAEMLGMVGMEGFEKRRPAELSGGERQRVALARTLVVEPRVVLMDEPLSSLDPDLNRRMRSEILKLHQRLRFAMVYVTHSREEAFEIATRLVVMKKGRIEVEGGVEEVRGYAG